MMGWPNDAKQIFAEISLRTYKSSFLKLMAGPSNALLLFVETFSFQYLFPFAVTYFR